MTSEEKSAKIKKSMTIDPSIYELVGELVDSPLQKKFASRSAVYEYAISLFLEEKVRRDADGNMYLVDDPQSASKAASPKTSHRRKNPYLD